MYKRQAWDKSWETTLDEFWETAWEPIRDAAWDAAGALTVRDLISQEHYDSLTRPLRIVGVTIHPDDEVASQQSVTKET